MCSYVRVLTVFDEIFWFPLFLFFRFIIMILINKYDSDDDDNNDDDEISPFTLG